MAVVNDAVFDREPHGEILGLGASNNTSNL